MPDNDNPGALYRPDASRWARSSFVPVLPPRFALEYEGYILSVLHKRQMEFPRPYTWTAAVQILDPLRTRSPLIDGAQATETVLTVTLAVQPWVVNNGGWGIESALWYVRDADPESLETMLRIERELAWPQPEV